MEWLETTRDKVFDKIDIMAETLLNYTRYYAGYNLQHNYIHKQKKIRKKPVPIEYYQEINFFNTILLIFTFVFLLLLILFYSKNCKPLTSLSIIDSIRELFTCDTFVFLFMSIVLITISYIIGGPVRIIFIIGFCILSVMVISKSKNIHTINETIQSVIQYVSSSKPNTLTNYNK